MWRLVIDHCLHVNHLVYFTVVLNKNWFGQFQFPRRSIASLYNKVLLHKVLNRNTEPITSSIRVSLVDHSGKLVEFHGLAFILVQNVADHTGVVEAQLVTDSFTILVIIGVA